MNASSANHHSVEDSISAKDVTSKWNEVFPYISHSLSLRQYTTATYCMGKGAPTSMRSGCQCFTSSSPPSLAPLSDHPLNPNLSYLSSFIFPSASVCNNVLTFICGIFGIRYMKIKTLFVASIASLLLLPKPVLSQITMAFGTLRMGTALTY
jgi:hypothetical protein